MYPLWPGGKKIAFSCKSSFCLSCGKVYTDEWVSHISEILHPGVVYRHVVLTVPKDLHIYFYRECEELYPALMKIGVKCLEDLIKTVRREEVKGGYVVVLQTAGRSGCYNPHLHIIMTDGGISEKSGKWIELGKFSYKLLHKKWEYYLLKMINEELKREEIKVLVSKLWKKYPNGFVAHIQDKKVPESCENLARYLGKYVVSPPISVKRIIKYDGKEVTYWYRDHKTEKKEVVTVDVITFIGRMVEHILPKGFKRIRYYGLQATKTFEKLKELVYKALNLIGRAIKEFRLVIGLKNYRERYKKVSGKDPFVCSLCGGELVLWEVWHPKYGVIYDEFEEMRKRNVYREISEELKEMEKNRNEKGMGTDTRRGSNNGGSGVLQLSLPFVWL